MLGDNSGYTSLDSLASTCLCEASVDQGRDDAIGARIAQCLQQVLGERTAEPPQNDKERLLGCLWVANECHHKQLGPCTERNFRDSKAAKLSHVLPLYVPLLGPVWSLSYSDVNKARGAWFWYGLLGAGEIAGTAIFVTGVVALWRAETDLKRPLLTNTAMTVDVRPSSPNRYLAARSEQP